MPARSAKFNYSPEDQRRFETQLSFIKEHRSDYPQLARSVAQETGYTSPNVYSVFTGATFNADIIRAGYAQICRAMGMLNPETLPEKGNEEDSKALRLIAEAQNTRTNLSKLLIDFRELRNKITRTTRDLKILDGNLELLLTICLEEMSDAVAVEVREYLSANQDPQEPPSVAVDLDVVPKEIIAAIAMLKANGEITDGGFLAMEPVTIGERFTPDGPEVDPMSPGRHVDTEGNEYFIGKD